MDSLREVFLGKKPEPEPDKTVLRKTPPPAMTPMRPSHSSTSLPTNLKPSSAPKPSLTTSSSKPTDSSAVQKSNSTSSTKSSTSQKSILKSPSNASTESKKSVTLPLPNNDVLPTAVMDLEGRLNHHTSQLQQLADRVERINEWIEMDEIVLRRLAKDAELAAEDARKAEAEKTTVDKRGGSVPQVAVSNPQGNTEVPTSGAVLEVRERVKGMKKWRKELERAVVWQREEHWRVEKAMGRGKKEKPRFAVVNPDGDGGSVTEPATIVGGYARERWAGGSGRLPSQGEWEELFGNGNGLGRK